VFATLHTNASAQSHSLIVDVFPAEPAWSARAT
jgi:hypothetical protein